MSAESVVNLEEITPTTNGHSPDGDEGWPRPEVPERFAVRDDATANWVVRKIAERRAYAARCAEWAGQEQRRAKRDEEFFLSVYGAQLMDFARGKMREQGGKRKSVSLPAGVIGFRTRPGGLVVDSETEVIAWAREHKPVLIIVTEKISKAGLNEHLQNTGELPDKGVHLEGEREQFFVR